MILEHKLTSVRPVIRNFACIVVTHHIGLEMLRSIIATLKQSLRFGTPLAESMRILAAEMRAARQAHIEERAARLRRF